MFISNKKEFEMSDYSVARQNEEQGRGKATSENRKGSEAIAGYCFWGTGAIIAIAIAWGLLSRLLGL